MGRTEETNVGAYVVPNAYAVVPGEDDIQMGQHNTNNRNNKPTTAFVQAEPVELNQPANNRSDYQHIPEARDLTWNDDYFENESGTVAVFDLDYEQMETYYESLSWIGYGATCLVPNCFWCLTLLGTPCYLQRNVQWSVRSQHVAITRDGVRFVKERRPTCWGLRCSDAGKMSRTIPFDKITDCDIVEAAGNTCFCVPNTLHSVHIDTANSREGQHELTIDGLQNPQAFKKLVWAMKRQTAVPASMGMLDRVVNASGGLNNDNGDVATLLRDIRDELREHNQVLQSLKAPPAASAPTADLV